ncbi:Arm DNA-binding domain-containing protein [Burkholderia sp. Tr-862]|uniref:Arm DNA-binding domain-containing protein n=1 Tax=Burkholderia sp. Tr-862 TaxID=2608331 RepID=UPI0032B50EA3
MRQAKAGNKPTKLTDGNGLYLEVRPSGSKRWRYRYGSGDGRRIQSRLRFCLPEELRHQTSIR